MFLPYSTCVAKIFDLFIRLFTDNLCIFAAEASWILLLKIANNVFVRF